MRNARHADKDMTTEQHEDARMIAVKIHHPSVVEHRASERPETV